MAQAGIGRGESMEIKRIQDKYNNRKVWILKRSKCGHCYYNQENSGYKLNKGFRRTTRRFLIEIFGLGHIRFNACMLIYFYGRDT